MHSNSFKHHKKCKRNKILTTATVLDVLTFIIPAAWILGYEYKVLPGIPYPDTNVWVILVAAAICFLLGLFVTMVIKIRDMLA